MTISVNNVPKLLALIFAALAVVETIGIPGLRLPGTALEWAACSVAMGLAR